MITKNILFILVCVFTMTLGKSVFCFEAFNNSFSWRKSPVTWAAEGTNNLILQPIANANGGTQLAFALGSLGIWTAYRWLYLQRPSWASLIPDKIRRFGNALLEGFGFGMARQKALDTEQYQQDLNSVKRYERHYGKQQNNPLQGKSVQPVFVNQPVIQQSNY